VPQDLAEAARWYRKAADRGSAVAQNNLGVLYAEGKGVRQDMAEADFWFALAAGAPAGANQGNAAANRDALAASLSANQIAAAQQRVQQWRPASPAP
jgi:TPR repeat protein